MLCSVVFLTGLVMLSRNGIFSFLGADICNSVPCAIKGQLIVCLMCLLYIKICFLIMSMKLAAQRINF